MWWRHNPEIKPDLNSPQLKLGFEYNVDYRNQKEKFDPKFSPLLWRHNEFLGDQRHHHKKGHTQNMFCTKFYQNHSSRFHFISKYLQKITILRD